MALECLKGRCDIVRSPDFERQVLEVECARRFLNLMHFEHRCMTADIGHDRQATEAGDNLTKEFEPLASKIGELERQAGDVATGSCQTCDEAGANRVRRYREDNWDDRCHLLGRDGCFVSPRDDDIDLESRQTRP